MDMFNTINPKLREFFERKKDITMMGAMWAFYWRWLLLMTTVFFAFFLAVLVMLLSARVLFT